MKQGMVSNSRSGSITIWAWTASIVVHLIALAVFGVVRFSQSETQELQRLAPVARVSQIKKLIEAAPVIPKPKIRKSVESQFSKSTNRPFSTNRIFDTAKPSSQAPVSRWQEFTNSSVSQSSNSAGSEILPEGIEFFGSWTDQRKVCYLVDCSGSMQGLFGRVRKELTKSVQNLQPDQYFYIIFFGGDRLFEFGNGRLIRATQKTKSAASEFINSVRPTGRTNALSALERAVQIRDSSGASAAVIYFLTDGFELTTQDVQSFPQKITNLLKRFAPMTKINTIGFWPQSKDREILKTIARQSGGESVFITDMNGRKSKNNW